MAIRYYPQAAVVPEACILRFALKSRAGDEISQWFKRRFGINTVPQESGCRNANVLPACGYVLACTPG